MFHHKICIVVVSTLVPAIFICCYLKSLRYFHELAETSENKNCMRGVGGNHLQIYKIMRAQNTNSFGGMETPIRPAVWKDRIVCHKKAQVK